MEYVKRLLLLLVIVSFLWFFLEIGAQSTESKDNYISINSATLSTFDANKFKMEKMELLLDEIIRRESGGDPNICNLQFGCTAGAGLAGIIPSTLRTCEIGLGRNLDVFNPNDNKSCAYWLLGTRGIWPWQPYSGDYSSILIKLGLYQELW